MFLFFSSFDANYPDDHPHELLFYFAVANAHTLCKRILLLWCEKNKRFKNSRWFCWWEKSRSLAICWSCLSISFFKTRKNTACPTYPPVILRNKTGNRGCCVRWKLLQKCIFHGFQFVDKKKIGRKEKKQNRRYNFTTRERRIAKHLFLTRVYVQV